MMQASEKGHLAPPKIVGGAKWKFSEAIPPRSRVSTPIKYLKMLFRTLKKGVETLKGRELAPPQKKTKDL